ncbi:MAG: murein L,D-transpeptidase catalytic domain family protein [Bacteroidia bacterium]
MISFFLLANSAFTSVVDDESSSPKRLITLTSDEFSRYTSLVYHHLSFDKDTLDYEVLHKALKGYTYLKATDQLENDRYLTVIDFTQYCNDKRLWVIDLQEKKVIFNELVAHGRRSGSSFANTFSNQHRSNKSSLGFYITGGTYQGRNGLSLKLNGIEKRFNSNAFSRGIVIHGANYVNNRFVDNNERIGRSFGCPAVDAKVNRELVSILKGGSCLFVYHSSPYYNAQSYLVNADLYIPAEELK